MKLFFDCRYTRTQVHDGISRFTASLVEAAAEQADVTMLISDPQQLNLLPALPHLQISSPTSAREPWVARQINPHRPDVVFSPMQTMGGRGRNYPLILTLHDLIYYAHRTPPRDLPALVRLGWRAYHLSYLPQRLVLNQADAVATVSETTRGLIRRHRLTRRPVELISNAPPAVECPREPGAAPTKELIYMGSFMGYKNVESVIAGLNRLPGYTLHLCSPIQAAREAQLRTLAADPEQLVFHHGISDADYRTLLRRASALVTLSQAEGYGLPVVEAMAHGTPCVVSDLPIFREIGGAAMAEAGTQVVPGQDAEALAQAVRRLQDPATFARASIAARARSQEFSWADSASALVALGERLAGHGRAARR
ncbi:glycosyltransferase family 4 protein [Nesterenkonia sp. LB17]|uniref:glycosyltransferase family 4 protein n=1 Tax=unclassified Nesterenkonia TaxID=2629769 RepID=UPI001F4D03FB|nr:MULTISPECIES: glycosyltransferase family 1 protein [unclassified Nesterenkonia]MCH8559750.1 glycosyltransferase family 4 protein [Nesterenkonia sp. DZ6]MCH8561914.1 glycosyltransferase family 4 protein [Nesterenkonia sp. YGD6]MCH8564549.1 glycosyltransferase family 4 protein [Nesterenkonia sp. LB17]MCH8570175.1 glycosyltransferase family 4 protein [Nesterenkonia sp. AY15]